MQTTLYGYALALIAQGSLNIIFCHIRDDEFDPECIYMPFKFT